MTRERVRLWVTGLATMGVLACGGDGGNEPDDPPVEGAWVGAFNAGSTPATLQMTLTETDGAVTGTGTLSGTSALAITVTGTFVAPSVSLTLANPQVNDLNLTATVGETQMVGQLNGSGFINEPVTLSRQ